VPGSVLELNISISCCSGPGFCYSAFTYFLWSSLIYLTERSF